MLELAVALVSNFQSEAHRMLAKEVFLVNLSCYYNVLLYDIMVTKRVIWSADNVKCLFYLRMVVNHNPTFR